MILSMCLLLLATWSLSTSECISSKESRPLTCPTWMFRSSVNHSECVCGDGLSGTVFCDAESSTVYLKKHFCIFFSEEWNSPLVGSCPYSHGGLLPKNVSELKGFICGHLHRKGWLCGECEDNYTLPVYSYNPGCVKCKDFKHGWIKFIAAAFLPLTFFYIVVIVFRISATSSALNGYVLVSQLAATSAGIRAIYYSNHFRLSGNDSYRAAPSVDFFVTIYAIWNLDFFRSFYQPICLHPDITYPQILLLDYAVAVYPLLLIFTTFILVKLHDNFSIFVWLWRPFHKCLVLFRKKWNIRSYLVNALATFVVLSYVKTLNVSFEFLTPSHVYNVERQSINLKRAYWYYNGTIEMTSKAYLPYLVLALLMLIIFNIFPLILLSLYPFRCFQRFLNCCLPSIKCKLALQIFMDTFHGCYRDSTTHDHRHFAALYLAVRFFNILLYSVFSDGDHYVLITLLLLVFILALVAKFQPYKCKRSNTVDIVMLLAVISVSTSHCMNSETHVMFPNWLNIIIASTSALIPPSYMLFLILAQILPKVLQCLTRSKRFVLNKMKRFKVRMNAEDQKLLNHRVADYNACS